MSSIQIWETEYSSILIPEEFKDMRFTYSGNPDMRCKKYSQFVAWAEEQRSKRANELMRDIEYTEIQND